ncbi:MAG: dTMP kinase [Gammaproteobacteria bacterium]|nr:dTMP kinase [Gammaproteobacteria bacterium]
MKQQGYLITLEGIEGVGKSTHMEFIQHVLEAKGITPLMTREPGGTPIAEAIRHVFASHHDEPMTDETEFLLLFAARAQHVQARIKPSLTSGKWVVCDRYIDASYAYQGGGRGIPLERIAQLEAWVCQGCLPDLTLLLDAPVPLALSRIQCRAAADRVESEKVVFFQRVRDAYLARAAQFSARFRVIDASGSPESVQMQLHTVLTEFIENH